MMEGEWTNPPFSIRLRDRSAVGCITEGALVGYSGMVFQADGAWVLHARLGHSEPASYGFRSRYAKDVERLKKPAAINGPITTPWRIVMTGENWNALTNSDIELAERQKLDADRRSDFENLAGWRHPAGLRITRKTTTLSVSWWAASRNAPVGSIPQFRGVLPWVGVSRELRGR